MVFQHNPSGRVFYGSDSGCSCPSPFEDDHFAGPDDTSFEEVTKINFKDFVSSLQGHYPGTSQDEKRDIERKVKEILFKRKKK